MSGRKELIQSFIRRARDEGIEDPWELADRVIHLWLSEAVPELGQEPPDEDEVFEVALEFEDGGSKSKDPS